MRVAFASIGLATTLVLAGCEPANVPQAETQAEVRAAETRSDVGTVDQPGTAADTGAVPKDDGRSDLTPPVLTDEAERGVEGARNILLSFARAIEEKEFSQAWSLLSSADQRKWSRIEFAALFGDLNEIIVAVPEGRLEGTAGSSYYAAPVTVTGNDAEGRPVRIEGEAVLRRINDVDGASAAQLRWHFERLTLDWTH